MLAALHKESSQDPTTMELVNTNSVVKWYYEGSSTSPTTLFKHNQDEGQSLLPHIDGSTTNYAIGTFTPNSNAFGFKVDSRFSDDTLNPLDFNETDPNMTPFPNTGHAFRFYPIIDSNGNLVPNTYLMAMDYTGISYSNYDYQDNIYLVSNIAPVNAPSAPGSVAASTSDAGITVSWGANAEGNVVGYRVYRSSSANGTYSLLTTSLVTSLRYTDVLAPSGQTSFYRVTAVDANGNESAFTGTSAALGRGCDPAVGAGESFRGGRAQFDPDHLGRQSRNRHRRVQRLSIRQLRRRIHEAKHRRPAHHADLHRHRRARRRDELLPGDGGRYVGQ